MVVFTMPGYDVVFKVIRDRFGPTKTVTRAQVKERYQFVFEHDRAGRLVDIQEYEFLEFARDRFAPDILEELLAECSETVALQGDDVVIRHLYTERRVVPLNLFIREAPEEEVREAVLEFGRALRDLAATNIFPGDLLVKNFGVTRHGRVVFYDYDELCAVTDCDFRELPERGRLDGGGGDGPSFYVGPRDVFPEEFLTFMGFPKPLRVLFAAAHADLVRPEFWNEMKRRHAAGRGPRRLPLSARAPAPAPSGGLTAGRCDAAGLSRRPGAARIRGSGGFEMADTKMPAPPNGETIRIVDGKLVVPDNPIIPFIEGDGTGPDIWRASVRVLDAAVAKAYGGKRKIAWMEVLAGQKSYDSSRNVASRRDGRGVPGVPRRHQGTAHDAHRRRHPLAERRPAPAPRPLRLPPPRALVQGRPLAGEAAREGRHGDLPGEHRGHLRRHRVRGRERRREEGPRVPEGELAGDVQEDPLPRDGGHRLQARLEGRDRAARPRRDPLRDREQERRASPSSTRATS